MVCIRLELLLFFYLMFFLFDVGFNVILGVFLFYGCLFGFFYIMVFVLNFSGREGTRRERIERKGRIGKGGKEEVNYCFFYY